MKKNFSGWMLLAGLLAIGGCATAPLRTGNDNLNSTLWVQTASEYKASAIQAYNAAGATIDQAINDRSWTAAFEQTGRYASLPVAIVLDIDETVLDNSRYQAQLVLDGSAFSPETWDRWIALKRAPAVPGAVDFINGMDSKDVAVFYITNRECSPRPGSTDRCPQEQDTIDNLVTVGIRNVRPENVMLKNEQPAWSSEKASRRAAVAEKYRIVMLFGDDLGDFLPNVQKNITPAQRDERVRRYGQHWGSRWIILSNPAYGSWLRVLDEPKTMCLDGF